MSAAPGGGEGPAPASTGLEADPEAEAMALIELLADEVGPRRPTSRNEGLAALLLRDRLRRRGLGAEVERFQGYASFGYPFAVIQAAALLPELLPARRRLARSAIALASGAALASEGSLRLTPLSRLLSRNRSGNVVATVEPSGPARRTLCLMAHMDSSRSGLIFDPRFVSMLGAWISLQSVASLAQAAGEPLLGGSRRGRQLLRGARGVLAAGLLLLIEREIRGEDVPGANDNASGCAVAAVLAAEAAAAPLGSTRLVLCLTGCEESGTLGSQAFLDAHGTDGWLFLNIDNVGGPGSVRYLRREGVLAKWDADAGLIAAAERVAEADPELRLLPEDSPAGLTYDSSPVLARGGRALTLSVQDGSIPNLHWPTDTVENVDPGGVSRTLRAARGIVHEVDAGTADPR